MHSRSSDRSAASATGADPLAEVIRLLRPQTVLSKIVSGRGQWSVRYAAHEEPSFGIVLEGSCLLEPEGIGTLELEQGDFVFFPMTPAFTMATDLALKPVPGSPARVEEVRHGAKTGSASFRMLGGFFRFDRANAELLGRFLPPVVLVRRSEPGAKRLRRLVELIGEEAPEERPGRDLILERLVEVLLVEALRFRSASARQPEAGFLAGLADPALARALRRFHDDVAQRWTVASLARAAGMSRAVFAERFTRKVGMPPMHYLLEWRLALAKDLLRRARTPLAEVAEKIGYQSASAFSTAFTRHVGFPPSAFVRRSAADAA